MGHDRKFKIFSGGTSREVASPQEEHRNDDQIPQFWFVPTLLCICLTARPNLRYHSRCPNVQKDCRLTCTLGFTRRHSEVSLARISLHVQPRSLILKMRSRAGSTSPLEGGWLDPWLPNSRKRPSEARKDHVSQGSSGLSSMVTNNPNSSVASPSHHVP